MKEIKRIGCSGWSYKEWKGLFYPEKLAPTKYLAYYAEHFNTLEVNNTFYRLPSEKNMEAWEQKVPKDFKFCLKVNKYITHTKRLKEVSHELKIFYGLSDILQEKMGAFLFQFPRSYSFNEERLKRLLSNLDPAHENVIEFRHPSWWASNVFEALSSVNATFCTVSGLDVPDDLIVLKGRAYIRFHGDSHYSSAYSEADLYCWKEKIQASCPENLWIYFNNTAMGHAPTNALFMKALMEE
ncbi:MAG: DUF72 domain-containing protein [Candidatus Paracaedibacter sp.]